MICLQRIYNLLLFHAIIYSKRNETFGNVIFSPNVIQETWTLLQEVPEAVTRVEGAPAYLVGPLTLHRRTPSYIYLRIPERSEQEPKT